MGLANPVSTADLGLARWPLGIPHNPHYVDTLCLFRIMFGLNAVDRDSGARAASPFLPEGMEYPDRTTGIATRSLTAPVAGS
jgi:hypothetical protein